MFVSKENRIRHEILRHFFYFYQHTIITFKDETTIGIPIQNFVDKIKEPRGKILMAAAVLRAAGEISYDFNEGSDIVFQSTDKTSSAFIEEKYLISNQEKIKNSMDLVLKFVGLAAFFFTVGTFIYTCIQSRDNRGEIQKLQKQVQEIANRANTLAPPKK